MPSPPFFSNLFSLVALLHSKFAADPEIQTAIARVRHEIAPEIEKLKKSLVGGVQRKASIEYDEKDDTDYFD